ncbi:MAG: hypothetical protein BMS9Abin02_0808 [Anaerolineae bacterium]|nr:MAG: hypothetical protein BMS9Abin02_0808 [Anaerolineae bacterium]
MYNRPTGVTIIALAALLGGTIAICYAAGAFAIKPITSAFGNGQWGATAYYLVRGVIFVIVAMGLYNLKPWARIGSILLASIHIGVSLYFLIVFGAWSVDWLGVIISVAMFVYLLKKDIVYTFKG